MIAPSQSMQDRQGLHTFARGNVVVYQQRKEGEPYFEAVIFGCCYQPADAEQARKVLVLYDQGAGVFFLGTWPAWQRKSRLAATPDQVFDCDDDDQVKCISAEGVLRNTGFFRFWALSEPLVSRGTSLLGFKRANSRAYEPLSSAQLRPQKLCLGGAGRPPRRTRPL